jgi:2-phosphoglycerate kinase
MVYEDISRPTVIFIYGIPGTGKSTLASILSTKLYSASIISTDIVREMVLDNDLSENLWLNSVSHQAWKQFGKKTEQTIVKGFENHAEAVNLYVESLIHRLIKKHNIVIIEGVHFTKKILTQFSHQSFEFIPIVLHLPMDKHMNRLEEKLKIRQQKENVWLQNYAVMTVLDHYYASLKDEKTIVIEDEHQLTSAMDRLEEHFKYAEVLR